jgi:hypothetical protein
MLSRRDFLKLAGLGAGAALLGGCASAPHLIPTATPLPTPTRPAPGKSSPPADRKLCFVMWDHELKRYSYKPRNPRRPVPMTCPLYSGATNTLTPAWIAYWKGLLHLCNPDVNEAEFQSGWLSLVASDRAFTNGTGPETGNFAIHSLTCGGATHEMVTGEPEKGDHVRIYTLNIHKAPPPLPATPDEIDMTRHFFATTGSNTRFPDGSYGVYGFPQFENCIVPLISNDDTDLIDAYRIRRVSELQNPYHTWQSQAPRVGEHKR